MSEDMDLEPIESAETELVKVTNEGDPEVTLAILEKKAALAPRMTTAINTVLLAATYPDDWTEQGGKMCLSSAGAERVARHFSIRFYDQKCTKEDFADSVGRAYRYVYECKAALGDREVFAQGAYSTRDKFLGYAHGEWKAKEDINENNIRNAAYHICIGNAIKALLGLRGIPAARFREIMGQTGQNANGAKSVRRGSGTKGGTTQGDSDKQKELAELCIDIANSGFTVEKKDKKWAPVRVSDSEDRTGTELAKHICVSLSSFVGKNGSDVAGLPAGELKGKRLDITLSTTYTAHTAMEGMLEEGEGGEGW